MTGGFTTLTINPGERAKSGRKRHISACLANALKSWIATCGSISARLNRDILDLPVRVSKHIASLQYAASFRHSHREEYYTDLRKCVSF